MLVKNKKDTTSYPDLNVQKIKEKFIGLEIFKKIVSVMLIITMH